MNLEDLDIGYKFDNKYKSAIITSIDNEFVYFKYTNNNRKLLYTSDNRLSHHLFLSHINSIWKPCNNTIRKIKINSLW